jgi:hypothetical protein
MFISVQQSEVRMSTKQRYVAVLADTEGNVLSQKGMIAAMVAAANGAITGTQNTSNGDVKEEQAYTDFIKKSGYNAPVIKAIVKVESGGKAYINGRVVVRFEPHVFLRMYAAKLLGKTKSKRSERIRVGKTVLLPGMPLPPAAKVIKTGSKGCRVIQSALVTSDEGLLRFSDKKRNYQHRQAIEYEALELARELDSDVAYQSCSWGLGQIMGFNAQLVGYGTAFEMAQDFLKSPWRQRTAIVAFINNNEQRDKVTNRTVREAVLDNDFESFARIYNGDTTGKYARKIREKLNITA